MSKFVLGVLVGILALSTANLLGERRYSQAIQNCIQEFGVNK